MNQKLSPRRRALSFLLALSLMLGLLPPTSAQAAEGASAAPPEHWAASYLNQMVEWGFIRADQAQNPDRALTRADFMSIVNRAYGYHEVGETPFEDVSEYDWFYDDVGIAYNAGYIKGTSPTTASPNDPLNRETATTILGRNMMLQESPGELLDFSDARDISNWARGTIKSSMEHYLVNGYDDGTFRPKQSMNWGEIAALVTRTIGTPLQDEGDYSLGGVFGNVTVTSPGVTLRDTVISGDLYVTGGVGLGGIKLENVTVLGRIIASGTGNSEGGASILLRNVTADELLIDNLQDKEVSIQADGITEIGKTTVRTSAFIQDNTPEGLGLHMISLEGDYYGEDEEVPEGWEPPRLTLAGRVEEVVNKTPNSTVHAAKGTVAKLTVDEAATGSHVVIDRGAVVENLILDTGVDVTGEGDIGRLEVNAPGCDVEMLPDEIVIRPGITAIIAGEEMDSASADEFLLDPMILAGYPKAQDIAPTSLEAVFATNKKGRIYWAVSAITDGSIGADELIKPPSYGNKAVKWGTVDSPRGNEETIAQITGLEPNGSYYLSAVLEDAKGQLSPVKVISFTTPDNTVPAFNTGYPYMSKVSPSDSVVVVSPNKDCKLYYALLPEGATPPTENELKTNAVAGALGFGVRDVLKNVEDVFRVNDVILEEQTNYILYLWLVDANGANKSQIVPLPFTTDDETPPEFIVEPTVNTVQATSVGLTFRLNENGTVYWVAVPAGTVYPKPEPGTDFETAPLTSDYAKLQVSSGMNIGTDGKAGKVTAVENVDGTITVTGLQPEQAYDFYYVAKDNAGPDRNYSVTVKKITINTLDTSGPKFSQFFSKTASTDNTVDPKSDTDIYLDVSENIRYAGSGGGRSFLELYQDVKNASGDSARAAAINKLASNLYGAIRLHKVNTLDGSEEDVGYNVTYGADFAAGMTIDYTQATVETHEKGIRITFPASGLHLENGAEYYFTIQDVTDVSNNQNPLANPPVVDFKHNEALSAAAGHHVPPFIVESATVMLTSPGVGAGDGPFVRDTSGAPTAEAARIDMSFRMTPNSTKTVSDTLSYDVLLWTDSICTYDLYYRVLDSKAAKIHTGAGSAQTVYPAANQVNLLPHNGGTEDRNVDANGWIYLGNSGAVNPSNGQWNGRSVNKSFNNCSATTFPLLKNLSSDLRYEFVIVLQSYGGNEVHDTWNGEVKFHVNVAAGQSNNLDNLGGALTQATWEDAQKKGLNSGARSIGRQTISTEMPADTLEISRRFSDSRLPTFVNGAPTFTKTTYNSTVINYTLSTAGTLYYAIGRAENGPNKVPEITTTRKLTEEEKALPAGDLHMTPVAGEAGVYYIKTDDTMPQGNQVVSRAPTTSGVSIPDWMIGYDENNPGTDLPEGDNLIVNPKPLYIFNPGAWTDTAAAITGSSQTQGVRSVEVPVEGLEPNTTYYAYFVIKGEADTLSHVYIFQFTTEEASKPKIDLGRQEKGATIRTDIDAELEYLVFTLRDATSNDIKMLQEPFTGPNLNPDYGVQTKDNDGTVTGTELPSAYTKDLAAGDTFTVLDALLTTYQASTATSGGDSPVLPVDKNGNASAYNGFSVFDIFASEALKTRMSDFLRGRYQNSFLSSNVDYADRSDTPLKMTGNVTKNEDLDISEGTDFVILAVAHVPNPDPKAEEWQIDSYAAYAPIRLGKVTPPEKRSWAANLVMGGPNDSPYQGFVTISFDQLIYSDDKGSVELDAGTLLDSGTWQLEGIKNRVTTSVDSDSRQTTITIRSNPDGGWENGDYIFIPRTKLHNYNGGAATKDLEIRVSRMPNNAGMRITLKWGSETEVFDFPFEVDDTNVSVDITCTSPDPENSSYVEVTGSPSGTQTLNISESITPRQVTLTASVFPTAYQTGAVYTWTSTNSNVIRPVRTGAQTVRSMDFEVVGTGEATITVSVVTVMNDGTQRTSRKQINVVVNGAINLTNATGAQIGYTSGSNAFTMELSPTLTNPTATLTFTSELPVGVTSSSAIDVITSPSQLFAITRELSADRRTITVVVTLRGSVPTNRNATLTLVAGTLTREVSITFTGSQSGSGASGASHMPSNIK